MIESLITALLIVCVAIMALFAGKLWGKQDGYPLLESLAIAREEAGQLGQERNRLRVDLELCQSRAKRFNEEADGLELKLEESLNRERALNRTLADLREMLAVVNEG
jgi:hypothetical protein